MSIASDRIKVLLEKADSITNSATFTWFRYDQFQAFIKNPRNDLGYIALQNSVRVGLPIVIQNDRTTTDTTYQFYQYFTDHYLIDIYTQELTGYEVLSSLMLAYQTDNDILEAGLGCQGFSTLTNMTAVGDMPSTLKSRWQVTGYFNVLNTIPESSVPLSAEIVIDGKVGTFAEFQLSIS